LHGDKGMLTSDFLEIARLKKNTVGKESYKARAYVPVFQRSITYVSCTSISSNLAKQYADFRFLEIHM
jgi:hypothetical protein